MNRQLQSSSIIHFFDAHTKHSNKRDLLSYIPPRVAVLISQINRHPVFLGVLGIIPNQIRTLLKECNFGDPENALQDISRTLFFSGFRIWSKRQQLVSRYWKEVGQRLNKGIKTKGKKRKKENVEDKLIESNCMNPFHYLCRHSNLSKQRPTKCPCRNLADNKVLQKNQLITEFVFKYHDNANTNFRSKPSLNYRFMTRADYIRGEHDRGKKRRLFIQHSPFIRDISKKSRS